MVRLESPLLNVLSNDTKLVVLVTNFADECIAEDMMPSDKEAEDISPCDNEVMIGLGLAFNVEETEVMFKLAVYDILSFSGQSKKPHPSMVVFLINKKGRPASAHCSRESEMLLTDETLSVMLMAVLGNLSTY